MKIYIFSLTEIENKIIIIEPLKSSRFGEFKRFRFTFLWLARTYIEWQYTHGVVLLYLPAGAKFVKRTFGHPREDVNLNGRYSVKTCWISTHSHHRVYPVLLVSLGEGDHLNPKREESSVEKPVHKEHLTCKAGKL